MAGKNKQPNGKPEYKVSVGGGKVTPKGTLKAVHKAQFDAKSWSILGILLTIICGAISYGIYELVPMSTGLKIALPVIVFCLLLIIVWWQRYRVLRFTHWVDRKFTATKTYHIK